MRAFLTLYVFLFSLPAYSQVEHALIRRLVVFPLQAPIKYNQAAEEAWWEIRKVLTDNKRFLVASKNFLQQKDVYQSRGELKPADAIILGQLLDANAVMTTYLEDKILKMRVYEGEYGRLLWEQDLKLQPSVPVSHQLVSSSVKLVRDFISSIPYHGFVFKDGLKSEVVYSENGKKYFKSEVGADAQLEVGDKVQLVNIVSDSLKPLFISGANIEVFAEGIVEMVDREIITVSLQRVSQMDAIKENSMVRIPKELKRLKEQYALTESLKKNIQPEYFSPELTELEQEVRENKPLVTSLSFLGNLVLFLLIAI